MDVIFGVGQQDVELLGKIKHAGDDIRHCVVLTDRARLREAVGDTALDLEIKMRRYCSARHTAGWTYHILDATANRFGAAPATDWQAHVRLLEKAVGHFEFGTGTKVAAVMLVGDETIIPMPCFENPLYDGPGSFPDADVDSDLPYSSMSVDNPFYSIEALEPVLPVARIPTGKRDSGEVGLSYFTRDPLAGEQGSESSSSHGLSAQVWQGASSAVAAAASIQPLVTCPDQSLLPPLSGVATTARYLYFNVHGSDEAREWFGESEDGSNYPVAIEPSTLTGITTPNVLATEACYGARFIGHGPAESALLTALRSSTVAFSGSSRIAFGPASPPVGLADVIAQVFLSETRKGTHVGRALLLARQELLCTDEMLTPHNQLTVVQFNLFGDPTRSLPASAVAETQAKTITSDTSASGRQPRSRLSGDDPLARIGASMESSRRRLRIVLPDVLKQVDASLDATWRSVEEKINANVYETSPQLKDVQPSMKELRIGRLGKRVLQLGYARRGDKFYVGRVVYADRQGEILVDINSK
ncbi:hypothetical protein N8343_07750 [Akkermansiaceae bacterium]|nr:hypothetical protein [Akkermansiaceae bacterium]MDB4327566.1 hypothetical protein [bacterium]MDC1405539.1 hypothetical protein [Akkermansiaceae bacterium]